MKTLKSIYTAILIVIALVAFVMMTAEASTIKGQILCTGGSIIILLVAGRCLEKTGIIDRMED